MERRVGRTDNGRMFRKHSISTVCAAAILCGGEGLPAQTIYKQWDSSGAVTFADRPAADEILEPNTTFPSQRRDPLAVSRPPMPSNHSDVADALIRNTAMSSAHAAAVDFNEASGRLKRARERREEGIEPRPGERANSSGTDAMNMRYQMRQRGLQREVVAAERRSHQTSLIRNAYVVVLLNRQVAPR